MQYWNFLALFFDALNDKKHLLTIYLEFSKAFDTISIDILMKKLDNYGFRGEIYSWILSYLTSRMQHVSINDSSSDLLLTNMGVPQGSTMGAPAFYLYL